MAGAMIWRLPASNRAAVKDLDPQLLTIAPFGERPTTEPGAWVYSGVKVCQVSGPATLTVHPGTLDVTVNPTGPPSNS